MAPKKSRSKSPAPKRKSPAKPKKKVAAPEAGFDLNDPNVTLALTVIVLLALNVYKNGVPTGPIDVIGDFFDTLASDITCGCWPFGGLLFFGHVLNSAQGAGGGFWAGSLTNAAFAAFGPQIISDVLNGNAQSILANETNLTLLALCWYFANNNIPFTNFNIWTTIKGFAGNWLGEVLSLCSLCYVTGHVLDAASTPSTAGPLGFSVFAPFAFAGAVGASSQFFPLNKGIDLSSCSSQLYNSIAIAAFVVFWPQILSSPIGPAVNTVYAPLAGLVRGHVVLAAVVVNRLFGQFIPIDVVGTVANILQTVTGV